MSPDNLRRMIGRYDRDNARPHRLTGEPVIAARGDTTYRRVCASCWHVVDEVAERKAWMAKVGCKFDEPLGGGVCFSCLGKCCQHRYPGVSVCPRCSGELHEVVA